MSERKLPTRRRKFSKGKAIRISDLVYDTLDAGRARSKHRPYSWDSLLRRMLGLPDRSGRTQPLVEGILETTTGMFVLKMQNVTWDEIEELAYKVAHTAMMRKKAKAISPPIKLREFR